uniref:Uncharacterized protein n=1 Tax=Arundo donax TaxID=35708 RepID=A0A0A9EDT5_ARUDO
MLLLCAAAAAATASPPASASLRSCSAICAPGVRRRLLSRGLLG